MTITDPNADTFAAFASFLGTPLPEDPIEAIRILQREAAKEIERLIAFLDALGGDPDLEPSLGYSPYAHTAAMIDLEGDEVDEEPSLGWTGTINQTSSNRIGSMTDAERDDADKEATGDLEPSLAGRGGGYAYDAEGDPLNAGEQTNEDGTYAAPDPGICCSPESPPAASPAPARGVRCRPDGSVIP